MFQLKKQHFYTLFYMLPVLFATGLMGCASMGRPEGGLYDEEPPILVFSEPVEGATSVNKQRIQMRFNENIKLDKVLDKLTVSPPQKKMPRVSSNAKTLTIELQDSLQENTTYSIDLADAVQDNNEGNPMEGLSLLFSTGDHIDSLNIIGHLLNAYNLEPITGAYVGIYRIEDGVNADSLFLQKTFERAGKTDARGMFKILGCAPGSYRLYSLIDGNSNYQYDMFDEDIAFYDNIIELNEAYTPDSNLVLYSFNEGKVQRYLDDCARPDSIHINIRFATWMPEAPKLAFIMSDSTRIEGDSVLIPNYNATLDTLSYWIADTSLLALDTLNLELSYLYTDTLKNDIWKTENIILEKPVVKAPEKSADNKKKVRKSKKGKELPIDTLPQITYMSMKMLSNPSINIGEKPRFEVSEPIEHLDAQLFHLQIQKDTLWEDLPLRLVKDSLNPVRYTLYAEPHFTPGSNYRLIADSAAMHNIYGHPLKTNTFTFKEKTQEDYAHLLFNITGADSCAYVELLNASDKPIQQAKVIKGQAKFVHVPAGTYYARLTVDRNNNGKFDGGNLFNHQQPEQVYYFNAELQLRANWSFNQQWDIHATPALKQKPEKVKTNKPKEEKEKKSKNEEYLRKRGKL